MEETARRRPIDPDRIRETIVALCTAVGTDKSICPSEVARALDGENWRSHLSRVRSVAAELARKGRIDILRKGKPIDPDRVKGVIRLRLSASNTNHTD